MTIHTVEAAYHPTSKMAFLIDWLVTLKCNYDCAYCPIGDNGHDNSTNHPPYEKCITMLDQFYEYTDVIMAHKKKYFKDVIMNIYGGESIYHPRITDIITESTRRFEKYSDRWSLRRRITTNGTASEKNWKVLCEHIDGFTMSYHSTGPTKLKNLFKKNLEYLAKIKKEHDIIVCMYPTDDHWDDCINFLKYCKEHDFNARPKLLDGPSGVYQEHHLSDLSDFMPVNELAMINTTNTIDYQSRGCCGGRKMCMNRDLKNTKTLVPRGETGFTGWHCSANQFFLHGNASSGLYFTNKDCKVRPSGGRGHIATMESMPAYIKKLKSYNTTNFPTLVCAQKWCACGTCAPKSVHRESLDDILKIYNTNS